jgi:hypothetical protein
MGREFVIVEQGMPFVIILGAPDVLNSSASDCLKVAFIQTQQRDITREDVYIRYDVLAKWGCHFVN